MVKTKGWMIYESHLWSSLLIRSVLLHTDSLQPLGAQFWGIRPPSYLKAGTSVLKYTYFMSVYGCWHYRSSLEHVCHHMGNMRQITKTAQLCGGSFDWGCQEKHFTLQRTIHLGLLMGDKVKGTGDCLKMDPRKRESQFSIHKQSTCVFMAGRFCNQICRIETHKKPFLNKDAGAGNKSFAWCWFEEKKIKTTHWMMPTLRFVWGQCIINHTAAWLQIWNPNAAETAVCGF